MLAQRRRFILLALLMVALVAATSMISTWLLYQTALGEQKRRLHELVASQAFLVQEIDRVYATPGLKGSPDPLNEILNHLVRAHRKFQLESQSGEFTVAVKKGNTIRFLIVNGTRIPSINTYASVSFESPLAAPMKQALLGKSGTIIGKDYKGVKVLAAYTPLSLTDETLGIVAKINLSEIKDPFFRANFIIVAVGMMMILVGLSAFFKLSEPILMEMQSSEKKYRDLVEGANNLIIRVDESCNISFANDFASRFLKKEGVELIGEDAFNVLAGDTAPAPDKRTIAELYRFFGEQSGPRELNLKTKSGEAWISWTINPTIDSSGHVTELLCIGNDTTGQHYAREAKREIEERFRAIAKASPVGIIITELEGNLIYANERMNELFRLSPAEMSGQGWLRLIHAEDVGKLKSDWFTTRSAEYHTLEFRIVPQGNIRWVLGQIVDLMNEKGEAVGHVITFTDITKIKNAEAEHRRLSSAIEQAAEAVIITDMAARISYVNPAFERITGYSREEALGRNPSIMKSGEQDREFYDDLWATLTSGEVWFGRFINHKKDGSRYTHEATISQIRDRNEKPLGYVAVARDVSQQLSLEAQLRQAQKLESIGELAAGIAHEINTPTQYVTSNNQFIEDSFATIAEMLRNCESLVADILGEKEPAAILEKAKTAIDTQELNFLIEDIPNAIQESETGLKRIAEIVQSVKQLAHPGEVHKGLHNVNEIITNAITVSTNEWKYVAEIKLDLTENLEPLYCLKGEIGQVLLNLIVNAAHAIEGTIDTKSGELGTITISSSGTSSYTTITVADTGTGMPEEVIERAFDPFYTTKDVGKGTGQGLAIAHNVVVNLHGGNIWIDSEVGIGTTITITLPYATDESGDQCIIS